MLVIYYAIDSCSDSLQWLCADPLDIPTLSSYIVSQISKFSKPTNNSGAVVLDSLDSLDCLTTTDIPTNLSNLPTELLSVICTNLPLLSIIALRQTSKTLRARTNSLLTPHFWRTRLQTGEALPWLLPDEFDVEEAASASSLDCDWEEGLRVLSAMARDIDAHETKYEEASLPGATPIGLENRWRIWKMLRGMGVPGERAVVQLDRRWEDERLFTERL